MPDLTTTVSWPAFTEAIRREDIASIFAFPLVFGPLEIGAIDLYSTTPGTLTVEQQKQTLAMSGIVSRILLRYAIAGHAAEHTTTFSRRLIHQATGMVLAQVGTNPDDAYLIIQARAYADNRPMQDVAEDIIERRIRFGALHEMDEETP